MTAKKVLGVLAGTDISTEVTAKWANSADVVVAADGAANRILSVGIQPNVIVGDLDSLDPQLNRSELSIAQDDDQETTDCDKLLNLVQRLYPDDAFALIGLEGDRFDHVLASLHSVARLYPKTRLILRDGIGFIVTPDQPATVSSREGQTVSLIPLIPCEGVQMQGVHWAPKAELSPMGATSISNMASGDQVVASLAVGAAVMVLQTNTQEPFWE